MGGQEVLRGERKWGVTRWVSLIHRAALRASRPLSSGHRRAARWHGGLVVRGVVSLELLLWLWVHDSLVSLLLPAQACAHKPKSLDLRPNPMRRGHHKRKRLKWMAALWPRLSSPQFSDRAGSCLPRSSLVSTPLPSSPLPRFCPCVSLIVYCPCTPPPHPNTQIKSQGRPRRAASTRPALLPSPAAVVATSIPRSQAPRAPRLQSESYSLGSGLFVTSTFWLCQLPRLAVLSSKNAAFSRACHAQ